MRARRKEGLQGIYSMTRFPGYAHAIHGKGSRKDPYLIHVIFDDGQQELVPLSRGGQDYVITSAEPPPEPIQHVPASHQTRSPTSQQRSKRKFSPPQQTLSDGHHTPQQTLSPSAQSDAHVTPPPPDVTAPTQHELPAACSPLTEHHHKWLSYVASLRLTKWPTHLASDKKRVKYEVFLSQHADKGLPKDKRDWGKAVRTAVLRICPKGRKEDHYRQLEFYQWWRANPHLFLQHPAPERDVLDFVEKILVPPVEVKKAICVLRERCLAIGLSGNECRVDWRADWRKGAHRCSVCLSWSIPIHFAKTTTARCLSSRCVRAKEVMKAQAVEKRLRLQKLRSFLQRRVKAIACQSCKCTMHVY